MGNRQMIVQKGKRNAMREREREVLELTGRIGYEIWCGMDFISGNSLN